MPSQHAFAPRRAHDDDSVLASPVPSMLELSAAMRAVAAESELWPAIAALQRAACSLTRSHDATVVLYDRARGGAWTVDGSVMAGAFRELVARVADRGQREVFGRALVEPIGTAPARAVLALRAADPDGFAADDIALVAALTGGVAGTLNRLLAARR
jgi:hypothetical protein